MPPEFDDCLIDHQFLFKVEVKDVLATKYEPSFKVSRFCSDPKIIQKFKIDYSISKRISKRINIVPKVEYYSMEFDFLNIARKTIEDLKDSGVVRFSSSFFISFTIITAICTYY